MGSGKTTIARALAFRLNAKIVPVASTLKGVCQLNTECGTRVWTPQRCFISRVYLQDAGEQAKALKNENIWLTCVNAYVKYLHTLKEKPENIIIPDVRFEDELKFIKKEYNGKVFYIQSNTLNLPKRITQHPSETTIKPSMCDDVITGGSIKEAVERIIKYLHIKLEHNKKPRMYISFPMFKYKNDKYRTKKLKQYLDLIEKIWPGDYVFATQLDSNNKDPILRVNLDLNAVFSSDALLCIMEDVSIGCGMELLNAKLVEKLTATVSKFDHCWLRYYSDIYCINNDLIQGVNEAVTKMKRLLGVE